jgi:DNA-directed RNA polymerase specialized sigma24 family protein
MHADTLLDIAMMHSDSLILRAQTGDRSAQGRLVQLWYKRIYNFCFKFFLDHDVAMESSQKTFIAMCRYIRDLQDTTRFKPWLYKIAYNNVVRSALEPGGGELARMGVELCGR